MKLNNLSKRYWVLALIPLFLWTCNSNSSQDDSRSHTLAGEVFGTTYTIHYIGNDVDEDSVHSSVKKTLDLLNLTFSTYTDTSFISVFNGRFDNETFRSLLTLEEQRTVVAWMQKVWMTSEEVFQNTNGAFDPSAGQLFNLWGFAENKIVKIPDSAKVEDALTTIGFDKVIDRKIGLKDSGYYVNFNAVAKGFAVDVISELLQEKGLPHMVEIGGEMRMQGVKADSSLWTIGINTPRPGAGLGSAMYALSLTDMAVATSGNYRNFYEENGKVYAHTIDPRTGYPAQSDVLSATVLHEDCATADAYATAFMVLGSEKSIQLAEEKGLDYLLAVSGKDSAEFSVIASERVKSWKVKVY